MRGKRKLSMRMTGYKTPSKSSSKSLNALGSYYEQVSSSWFGTFFGNSGTLLGDYLSQSPVCVCKCYGLERH